MKRRRIKDISAAEVEYNPKISKRVILSDGELWGNMTGFSQAIIPHGERSGAHRHIDMAEIFTVVSGNGEMRVNDVAYVLNPEWMIQVEPGDEHEIINTGTYPLIINYFGVEQIEEE